MWDFYIFQAIFVGPHIIAVIAIVVWIWLRRRRKSRLAKDEHIWRREFAGVQESQRQAGEEGEQVVAGALRQTAARGGYYVFQGLVEPSAGDIDHLVVGPGGVTIVETKANGGTVTWEGPGEGTMLIDGKPFPRDPMEQMRRQTEAFERRFSKTSASEGRGAKPLSEYLGEDGRHWLWCFSRARLPGGQHTKRPHLTSPKNVARRIMDQRPLFDKSEVEYIAERIARAYGQHPDAYPSEGHFG